MIDVTDISQHYGVRPVLRHVSLHIEQGELVAVLGPNGVGKSTLLAVLGGVLPPQHGTVTIDGLRRRGSVEQELRIRQRVAYLPDHPWLPAGQTGREFLLAVGRLYDVAEDGLLEHVDRLLELFELTHLADQVIRSYSSGQQKKIALCSALVSEAPIMLLDEPFSGGLDPSGLLALKTVLRRRVEHEGYTVVLTSPVPELVEEIADRIAVLRDGQILAFDSLAGLRRASGCDGSLGKILELLLHPQTGANLVRYFERSTP